jgi:diguanylate cyclase (GGDEF)-like protein
MRATDFLARYGGDELTLVMRNTGLETAATVTAKLVDLMKTYRFPFPNPNEQAPKLGITAGIAVYPIHARNAGDLLRAADTSLYQGKKYNRGSFIVSKKVTSPLNPITIPRTKKIG